MKTIFPLFIYPWIFFYRYIYQFITSYSFLALKKTLVTYGRLVILANLHSDIRWNWRIYFEAEKIVNNYKFFYTVQFYLKIKYCNRWLFAKYPLVARVYDANCIYQRVKEERKVSSNVLRNNRFLLINSFRLLLFHLQWSGVRESRITKQLDFHCELSDTEKLMCANITITQDIFTVRIFDSCEFQWNGTIIRKRK